MEDMNHICIALTNQISISFPYDSIDFYERIP